MAWAVTWTTIIQAMRRGCRRAFQREPEPPFARAYWHAHDLFTLVNAYGQNPSPLSAKDLQDLVFLEKRLFELSGMCSRLIARLEQRFQDKP